MKWPFQFRNEIAAGIKLNIQSLGDDTNIPLPFACRKMSSIRRWAKKSQLTRYACYNRYKKKSINVFPQCRFVKKKGRAIFDSASFIANLK
jgi:hypothetical protein